MLVCGSLLTGMYCSTVRECLFPGVCHQKALPYGSALGMSTLPLPSLESEREWKVQALCINMTRQAVVKDSWAPSWRSSRWPSVIVCPSLFSLLIYTRPLSPRESSGKRRACCVYTVPWVCVCGMLVCVWQAGMLSAAFLNLCDRLGCYRQFSSTLTIIYHLFIFIDFFIWRGC